MIGLNEIPTHFGDVSVAQVGPYDRRIHSSPIEYKVSYINNLPMPITIGLRSGLKFALPPLLSMRDSTLVVRVEIHISHLLKIDVQKLLSAINNESSAELKVMREAFIIQINETYHGGVNLIIDYSLDATTLRKFGGVIYYHELDCIISLKEYGETPAHPYSEEGRKLQLLDVNSTDCTGNDFSYSVKLVDNFNKYGPRFININSSVYKINTTKDSSKKDGIYITSNKPFSGDVEATDGNKSLAYYSFDSEEIKLYLSAEEANSLGDSLINRKQKITELEHTSSVQRLELQQIKHEHEIQILEKTKEKLVLEMEREALKAKLEEMRSDYENRIKMEREQQKDHYEEKSYKRKDSSELLRWIPAIITGISAIVLAVAKSKK